MVCDDCSLKDNCTLLKEYLSHWELVESNDIKALNELYNLLEVHESYISEMRKDILRRIKILDRRRGF